MATNCVIALFKLGGIAVVLAFIFGELQDDNKMIAQSMCAGAVMLVVCFAYILWNDVCLPLIQICIRTALGEDAKDANPSISRSSCAGNDINSHIDKQQGPDQHAESSVSSPIQDTSAATTQDMTSDNEDEEPCSSQQKSPSSRLQTLEAKNESAEQVPSQREVSSSSSSLQLQRTSRMQEEPSATQIADKVQSRQMIVSAAPPLVPAKEMKDDGANQEESPSTLPIQEGPDLSNDHVNSFTSTQRLKNEKKGQEEEQTDEEPCLSSFRDNKSVSSVRPNVVTVDTTRRSMAASLSPLPSPSRLFEREEGGSSNKNDCNTMPESLGKVSSFTIEPTPHSSSLGAVVSSVMEAERDDAPAVDSLGGDDDDIDDNNDNGDDDDDDDVVYVHTAPADPDHSKKRRPLIKAEPSSPRVSLSAAESEPKPGTLRRSKRSRNRGDTRSMDEPQKCSQPRTVNMVKPPPINVVTALSAAERAEKTIRNGTSAPVASEMNEPETQHHGASSDALFGKKCLHNYGKAYMWLVGDVVGWDANAGRYVVKNLIGEAVDSFDQLSREEVTEGIRLYHEEKDCHYIPNDGLLRCMDVHSLASVGQIVEVLEGNQYRCHYFTYDHEEVFHERSIIEQRNNFKTYAPGPIRNGQSKDDVLKTVMKENMIVAAPIPGNFHQSTTNLFGKITKHDEKSFQVTVDQYGTITLSSSALHDAIATGAIWGFLNPYCQELLHDVYNRKMKTVYVKSSQKELTLKEARKKHMWNLESFSFSLPGERQRLVCGRHQALREALRVKYIWAIEQNERNDEVSNPTTSLAAVEDNSSSLNNQLQQGEAVQQPAPEAQSFKHSPSAIMAGRKRKRDPGDRRAAARSTGIRATLAGVKHGNRSPNQQSASSKTAPPVLNDTPRQWDEVLSFGPGYILENHKNSRAGFSTETRYVFICRCHKCLKESPLDAFMRTLPTQLVGLAFDNHGFISWDSQLPSVQVQPKPFRNQLQLLKGSTHDHLKKNGLRVADFPKCATIKEAAASHNDNQDKSHPSMSAKVKEEYFSESEDEKESPAKSKSPETDDDEESNRKTPAQPDDDVISVSSDSTISTVLCGSGLNY